MISKELGFLKQKRKKDVQIFIDKFDKYSPEDTTSLQY